MKTKNLMYPFNQELGLEKKEFTSGKVQTLLNNLRGDLQR